MGKLIISGNGKNTVSQMEWIIVVVGSLLLIVIGFWLANQFGYEQAVGRTLSALGVAFGVEVPEVRTVMYYIFAWGGVVLAGIILGWATLVSVYAGKTEILVFENGIQGAGGGVKFSQSLEDTVTISAFNLAYDRIASVDITRKHFITINAFGKIYVVVVSNGDEVIQAINEKMSLVKNQDGGD